ncbi:head-tail connector protein [Enterobacter asburiae]
MTIDVLDVVQLEELRQHVEMDTDDRDAVIKRYAQAALDYCLRWCDEPRWKVAADIPSPVVSAMLLVFGDLFEHRTSQTEVQLYTNAAAENLMFSCRNWSGVAVEEEGS